jgi:hypothetical protein
MKCDCGYDFNKGIVIPTHIDNHSLEPKGKRPRWVWVIFIFYLVSASYTLLAFYLTSIGAVPLTPTQKAFFENMTIVDYGITFLIGLTCIAGAIALFMMRKVAIYLFLISYSISMVFTLWVAATSTWIQAFGGGFVGFIMGWIINIAVLVYTWRLFKKGLLT